MFIWIIWDVYISFGVYVYMNYHFKLFRLIFEENNFKSNSLDVLQIQEIIKRVSKLIDWSSYITLARNYR